MDRETNRKVMISEYRAYLSTCLNKGESVIDFPVSDEELQTVSDSDLVSLLRRIKELARTPIS